MSHLRVEISHKQVHTAEEATVIQQQQHQAKLDRPGTTQRTPKVDFTGFENDPDFKRLLTRYPTLQAQLQLSYALTLEPGLSEKWTWNKQPLLSSLYPSPSQPSNRGQGRGRVRGRGRYDQRGGGRGMRGSFRGGRGMNFEEPPEDREQGSWTQAKGDKEALLAIKKMRMGGGEDDERAEGMREFGELCLIKFGPESEVKGMDRSD
ncbi:hypothetical protein LTR01_000339 [Friedmanniomyces endolithicus]|nr:hypothetical protein LTR01_000339 [Friedmanniomyces endolithicus]KAK0834766.1 hypothetical protein LTR73_001056 [Friedmanniomyces endolithicus]